jgi:four helix bundle protein
VRFLNISEGSLAETEYLLVLSRDLGYSSAAGAEQLLAEISEISRMLHGLRARVEQAIRDAQQTQAVGR